ncbi:MAG: hypothetical protein H8D87_05625 [Deltaproteobacteria bacterium]|nr:hypothetical protein [Candidatus Desulfobacula maris]MBL6995188.1 hypothetical protein [Desulfobacula sp.]
MDNKIKKENKKIWIKPEIKTITGFNVHENVVASSGPPPCPKGGFPPCN